jgi:hypothetical protein
MRTSIFRVFGGQLTTMTATTILCCPADKKDVSDRQHLLHSLAEAV